MKNVVFCGFMGCGKSTIGRLLASQMEYTFVDMDDYIEASANRRISDIFNTDGEQAFREMEHAACVALSAKQHLVIATGGGAVLRKDNVTALKQNGIIVWLDVSADTVLQRLKNDNTRPLLQHPDKDAVVTSLMAERAPLYRAAADIIVDADGDTERVTRAVLSLLSNR